MSLYHLFFSALVVAGLSPEQVDPQPKAPAQAAEQNPTAQGKPKGSMPISAMSPVISRALTGLEPETLKKLESMSNDEIKALLERQAKGEELTEQERAIAKAASAAVKRDFAGKLDYLTGKVELPGIAALDLPQDIRYLGPEDSTKVFQQLWGNSPREGLIGMLVRSDTSLINSKNGWAILITHEAKGHIDDSDGDALDSDRLLAGLQRAARKANDAAKQAGRPGLELVGWKTAPNYDAESRTLRWSEEVVSGQTKQTLLNDRMFVLVRGGALVFEAVAPIGQQEAVEATMAQIRSHVMINEGMRYGDFDPDKDPAASLDLAAVVLGKSRRAGGGPPWGLAVIAGLSAIAIGASMGVFGRRKRPAAPAADKAPAT